MSRPFRRLSLAGGTTGTRYSFWLQLLPSPLSSASPSPSYAHQDESIALAMVAVSTTAGAEPGSSSVEQATIVQAEAGNSCVGDSGTLFWSRPNVEGLTSYTVEHWAYSPVPSVLVTEVGAEQTSVLFTFRFGLNISWLCRQSAGAEALREPGMCRHRELNPLFGSHERPRKGSTSPPRTGSRLRVWRTEPDFGLEVSCGSHDPLVRGMSPSSMLRGTAADDSAGVDYVCPTCEHEATWATEPDSTPWCYGMKIPETRVRPSGEHKAQPIQFRRA